MILARVHTKTKTRERRERKKAQPIILSFGSHNEKKRNRRQRGRRRTAFVMTERLVLMVVLCDLEKVVRTDAAKEERKIAEDIYVSVCVNKILCDVFVPLLCFLFFLSPLWRFQISSQRTLKGRKPHHHQQQQQRYNSRWCLK